MNMNIARCSCLFALCLAAACQTTSSSSLSHTIDAKSVMHACRSYAANNEGNFPNSLDSLVVTDSSGAAYLQEAKLPLRDAWGTPYKYELLKEGKACKLVSLGKDKRGGGAGANEDMVFLMNSFR